MNKMCYSNQLFVDFVQTFKFVSFATMYMPCTNHKILLFRIIILTNMVEYTTQRTKTYSTATCLNQHAVNSVNYATINKIKITTQTRHHLENNPLMILINLSSILPFLLYPSHETIRQRKMWKTEEEKNKKTATNWKRKIASKAREKTSHTM